MIDPSAAYPGQVDVDANYPFGGPRNDSSPTDTSGTPLEKQWVADWFGFSQHVLTKMGVDPNGTPDTALACQLMSLIEKYFFASARYILTNDNYNNGVKVGLTEEFASEGFSLVSDNVFVPRKGIYYASIQAFGNSSADPDDAMYLTCDLNSSTQFRASNLNGAVYKPLDGGGLFQITNEATDDVAVRAWAGIGSTLDIAGTCRLNIFKVGPG